ncbi:hypothetical protein BCR23_10460 [Enterococcus quebecensis]|uniref:Uncharacterized protein n=2 Tax=Enterococcus quebecensis TaxID=903983 RepID=A0A1E5GR92_9ENTE|nr:hypothetical protein BCR23_10460 [Enterococcus quebecensis]
MKKRNSIIVIGLFFLVFLGVGGKYFMDEKKKEQEKGLIEIELQSIVILKQTFSDIKEVKIEKTGHNKATGSYRMFVTMTDIHDQKVSFTYGYWKERNELGDIGIEDSSIQKDGTTNSKIKVILSDGGVEYI